MSMRVASGCEKFSELFMVTFSYNQTKRLHGHQCNSLQWSYPTTTVMFRKDRIGRRGRGVILYVKESIQAYEIKLEREADCDEAVWCKIVSGNSKLTIGLVYRSPNINEEDKTKIKNAIKEVSKGECIIMGDFNHGHIQLNSLESTGIEDQQFLFLIQDSFLTQHVLEPTRGENVLDIVLSSQKRISGQCKNS